MKYCKQCGLLMADNATTCPGCGAAFVTENPLSMPQVVPAAPDVSPYTPPAAQQVPPQPQYATAGAAPQGGNTAACAPRSATGTTGNPGGAPYQGAAPQPGPAPQGGRTYYNQPQYGTPTDMNEPLTTGGYLFTLVVFMIPLIGLIMQLVWSFGGSENLARQSLSRAYLIRSLILFGIGLLSAIGIIAMLVAVGTSFGSYYY